MGKLQRSDVPLGIMVERLCPPETLRTITALYHIEGFKGVMLFERQWSDINKLDVTKRCWRITNWKNYRNGKCQRLAFPIMPETGVSRHKGGTRGAPIMPRDVSLSDSGCNFLQPACFVLFYDLRTFSVIIKGAVRLEISWTIFLLVPLSIISVQLSVPLKPPASSLGPGPEGGGGIPLHEPPPLLLKLLITQILMIPMGPQSDPNYAGSLSF